MLKNNDSSSEQSFTLPDDLSFPIKTIEKFQEMEIKLGDPSAYATKSFVYLLCMLKVPLRISKFLTEVAESNFEFWWLFESEASCSKIGSGSYIFFKQLFCFNR